MGQNRYTRWKYIKIITSLQGQPRSYLKEKKKKNQHLFYNCSTKGIEEPKLSRAKPLMWHYIFLMHISP